MLNNIRYIYSIFICLAAFLSADELFADNPLRGELVSVINVGPPKLAPVPSCYKSPSDPLDTLDTVNEHIKVILFGGNIIKLLIIRSFLMCSMSAGPQKERIPTRCPSLNFLHNGPSGVWTA
mgnify:CR=1 FL=1